MIEVEVIGVSIMPNKRQFYIHLANEQKIRVNYTEYSKMKKRLSGKSKIFMNVEESE